MTGRRRNKSFNDAAGRALVHLCRSDDATPEAMQALLDAGGDPDWRESDRDYTPLMAAVVYRNDPDLVRVLLRGGADVLLRDYRDHIVLSAARTGDMIRALLEKQPEKQLAARHLTSGTHLSHAVVHLDDDCVAAMLEAGADPAGAKNKDCPPLHWAVSRGEERKIDVLLAHSPDTQVNYVDTWSGRNAAMNLFNASRDMDDAAKVRYCTLLMNLGTDLAHRDYQDRTLLDYIAASADPVRIPLEKAHADALLAQTISNAVNGKVVAVCRPRLKRKGPQG